MTCIVGMLNPQDGNVIIGGDSAAVSGIEIQVEKQPKIFKNGDFIFGCTTSFRMIQLLKFQFQPPIIENSGPGFATVAKQAPVDIYAYMCTKFVDELRNCFKVGGILDTQNGIEHGGTFLVGYKERLFRINSDFYVMETLDGFDAVGCGQQYALGAMKQLESTKLSVQVKLAQALETAAHFSGGVVGPFHIVTT
jgi:ATP-dependent protease HslVU (ClpYQ) peptidase subunit